MDLVFTVLDACRPSSGTAFTNSGAARAADNVSNDFMVAVYWISEAVMIGIDVIVYLL